MSKKLNKDIVRRMFQELNKGNLDIVDEIFAVNFLNHNPGERAPDRQGLKELLSDMHTSFPDCHWRLEDLIADEDKVAYRFTMYGTDKGGYIGMPPTGKQVSFAAIGIFRFARGKVVERWYINDQMALLKQLGLI